MKDDVKKEVIKRLNITDGHLRKIVNMVESDRYCIDVLQQTEAVKGSLKKIEEMILDSHLHTCVAGLKGRREEKAIKEIVQAFRKH